MSIELAWKVIDHWVKADYGNDKEAAIAELCHPDDYRYPKNLDQLALRIVDTIEQNDFFQFADDIILLTASIELEGY